MKKLIAICLSIAAVQYSYAQDPHFSQFFASPLTLNPAFTGKFDGSVRVAGNYRNQWPTINNAFITGTASADFHVLQKKIAYNDIWGAGLVFFNDKSAGGAVNYNYASASTAYHKGLDEDGNHQLGLGLQATYANMSINPSNLTFGDQLQSDGFTGSTHETFSNSTLSVKYVDVNAGLLYTGNTNEKNNFYLGVSMYHINKPRVQFGSNGNYYLNTRTTIHGGGYFPVGYNNNMVLHVSALQTYQASASETVLGGALQLIANPDDVKPTSLYIGSWLRLNDAFIPYIGLEYSDYRLGVTYDVNTSSLKSASQSQGGIEISLIYIFRPNTDKPSKCPKF